jgi:hypothetical protein
MDDGFLLFSLTLVVKNGIVCHPQSQVYHGLLHSLLLEICHLPFCSTLGSAPGGLHIPPPTPPSTSVSSHIIEM